MAELQLPGSPALLDRVVDRAVRSGARRALPGEFTYRRFMAGKIDLTQAEGVAATIAAVSDAQLDAAARMRAGHLGSLAARFVGELADALALVESAIDFTDQEDVVPLPRPALIQRLASLHDALERLLAGSVAWARLDALPRVVLAGAPSVGKSTLFNALIGRQRVVTDAAWGTTRDRIAEPMRVDVGAGHAFEVLLEDAPGLTDAGAALDRRVRRAAESAAREADLVLWVDDGRGDAPPADGLAPGRCLPVRSKCDLAPDASTGNAVAVSAVTGAGLDRLRRAIGARLAGRGVSVEGAALVLQARHAEHLRSAQRLLAEAGAQLGCGTGEGVDDPELVAAAMRAALDELAGLGGAVTPDDVIGRVFTTFCVGK